MVDGVRLNAKDGFLNLCLDNGVMVMSDALEGIR